jgi:hypothetical protein
VPRGHTSELQAETCGDRLHVARRLTAPRLMRQVPWINRRDREMTAKITAYVHGRGRRPIYKTFKRTRPNHAMWCAEAFIEGLRRSIGKAVRSIKIEYSF